MNTRGGRKILENIRAILRGGAADLQDVAKLSVYVTQMSDFAAMNAVYTELFPPPDGPPARIRLQVAGLALGALVGRECIADRRLSAGD